MKTAILIAAAGASTRLERPKQLLKYKNKNLLQYMIDECLAFGDADIFVALGANGMEIEKLLDLSNCIVLHNPDWERGLGNTIAFGVSQIKREYREIILVLGDQVYFTQNNLMDLMKKRKVSDADIIVSRYQDGQGPPVLFDVSLRTKLEALEGDNGAKSIIKSGNYKIDFVDFHLGNLDVDSREDLHLLNL